MKYLFWIILTSALLSFTVARELTNTQVQKAPKAVAQQVLTINDLNDKQPTVPGQLALRYTTEPEDSATSIKLFTQSGNASYYAGQFHGRRTASGAIYHKDSLTAAHKTLKFGTLLKVTNLANDSVVIVKVTDRMGRSPHIIDLSLAGAKKLNFVRNGTAKVLIEEIRP